MVKRGLCSVDGLVGMHCCSNMFNLFQYMGTQAGEPLVEANKLADLLFGP